MEGSAAAVEGTAACETPELSSESSPAWGLHPRWRGAEGLCTPGGAGALRAGLGRGAGRALLCPDPRGVGLVSVAEGSTLEEGVCQRVTLRGAWAVGWSLWTSDREAGGVGQASVFHGPWGSQGCSSDRGHVTPSHSRPFSATLNSPGAGGAAGLVSERGLGPELPSSCVRRPRLRLTLGKCYEHVSYRAQLGASGTVTPRTQRLISQERSRAPRPTARAARSPGPPARPQHCEQR